MRHLVPLSIFLLLLSCSGRTTEAPRREVNLYVWSNYIPETVLDDFQRATGIKLNFDTFESNEALLEKIQSGLADYDVIVPSDYMVGILRAQKLLSKLDRGRVPNLRNIGPRFLNARYDPGNVYSVPFLWSTSGIGYNRARITKPVDSWSTLWDPEYVGRASMLDDARECFSVALKWKGLSLNTIDDAALQAAAALLTQQKPLLKAYNSSNYDMMLLDGDVWVAHAWSGDMARAATQNPDLAYVVPKEGGALAVENLAIPVNARHVEEAHVLINWLLDAQVGAAITNRSRYPNTNEAAKAHILPEILNDPVVYPDPQTLARCELIEDLGSANQLLDRYWTEIKSH
jgi:spermidine/putrescine-binding protein